nr:hypothetical protein [Lachnospiraceae bacterium]
SETELSYTPIVININEHSIKDLNKNVRYILSRRDIQNRQVFFLISSAVSIKELTRVINDLGVSEPQVIYSMDDTIIESYLSVYPFTNYINCYLQMLKKLTGEIESSLESDKTEIEESNKVINNQLSSIDDLIHRVRNVGYDFEKKDVIAVPDEWIECKDTIDDDIYRWKEKKTRISTESDFIAYSDEFDLYVHEEWKKFTDSISQLYNSSCNQVYENGYLKYSEICYEEDFKAVSSVPECIVDYEIGDIKLCLAELKHEECITQKEDFLGKIFGNSSSSETEMVTETAYYLKEWREMVSILMESKMNSVIKSYYEKLCQYSNLISNEYITKLNSIIAEEDVHKERIMSELSEDNKIIHEDMKWIDNLNEKIAIIERG